MSKGAIKKAIILCWIMLIACFIVKLFGGNLFEVICTDEHFIYVCEFIANNKIIYELLSYFVYTVPMIVVSMAMCFEPKPSKNQLALIVVSLTFVWIGRIFSSNSKSILEIIYFVFIPIICEFLKVKNFKSALSKSWYRGILGYGLILVFQIISMITKNVDLHYLNDNLVVTYILLIDYYIMVALYYFYIKLYKGENNG